MREVFDYKAITLEDLDKLKTFYFECNGDKKQIEVYEKDKYKKYTKELEDIYKNYLKDMEEKNGKNSK